MFEGLNQEDFEEQYIVTVDVADLGLIGVGEEKYGFVKGKIYQAYEIKSAFPNKHEMISVVDDFGEEYAYPREWFEIVK